MPVPTVNITKRIQDAISNTPWLKSREDMHDYIGQLDYVTVNEGDGYAAVIPLEPVPKDYIDDGSPDRNFLAVRLWNGLNYTDEIVELKGSSIVLEADPMLIVKASDILITFDLGNFVYYDPE